MMFHPDVKVETFYFFNSLVHPLIRFTGFPPLDFESWFLQME